MYYKIIAKLQDEIKVHKELTANGVEKREIRTPTERDFFKIENGTIKLISGRQDRNEFENVKIEYPKGIKEICLFVEKNKSSLFPMSEEMFLKDYRLNLRRNNLRYELVFMDMSIEDLRARMSNPATLQEKRAMNRLWNERYKIVRQMSKIEKKEQFLLSGKKKKKEYNVEVR